MSILSVDSIQPVSTGTTVTISNGDLIVGTGLTIGRSGVITATSFSGSGANLTALPSAQLGAGIPGANITGTIPQASLGNVDLSGLKKDIALLSLQNAVDTNRVAYNLANSFIDQYENDVGIAASTTVTRDTAGEFLSPKVITNTGIVPEFQQISSNPNTAPSTSSWSGGGETNDRFDNVMGSGHYAGAALDYVFDLSDDFTIRVFMCDASGNLDTAQWPANTILVFTDTSKTGASPANLWDTTLDIGEPFVMQNHAGNVKWQEALNDSYASTISVGSNQTHNYSQSNQISSPYTRSIAFSGSSTIISHYFNDTGKNYAGWEVKYTKSANTITSKFLANGSRSTTVDDADHLTMTSVPTTGRAMFGFGNAANPGSGNKFLATTYNGGSKTGLDYSIVRAMGQSATGICTSKQNTVTGARTKVSGVMLYKDNAGAATLGTDLKVSFSCNGGTNWTDLNQGSDYSAGSDFSTGVKTVYLAEKTCTSGTDIRYKLTWANQSGSKDTQVHGMALNY